MPIDPSDSIQAVERTLNSLPAAAFVIVLLTGPTILWLLYRFVVQPRTSRYAASREELLWVCADCRSVNEIGQTHCYHCSLDRAAITGPLQVFDGEGLVTLEPEIPDDGVEIIPVAVEIATPIEATALGTRPGAAPTVAAAAVPPPAAAPTRPRKLVAVGPGKRRTTAKATPATSAGSEDDTAPEPPQPVAIPVSSTRKRRTRTTTSARRGSTAMADPPDPIVEA
jgi:hypothetical protein